MTPNSICGRNSFFYLFLYLAAAVAAAEFASSITYWATARPPARVAHHGTLWHMAFGGTRPPEKTRKSQSMDGTGRRRGSNRPA